jgi:hypothetical protein
MVTAATVIASLASMTTAASSGHDGDGAICQQTTHTAMMMLANDRNVVEMMMMDSADVGFLELGEDRQTDDRGTRIGGRVQQFIPK